MRELKEHAVSAPVERTAAPVSPGFSVITTLLGRAAAAGHRHGQLCLVEDLATRQVRLIEIEAELSNEFEIKIVPFKT